MKSLNVQLKFWLNWIDVRVESGTEYDFGGVTLDKIHNTLDFGIVEVC